MRIIREFPYLVMYWDEECRSLIIQWRGGFQGRNLKEGLLAALEEFKKTPSECPMNWRHHGYRSHWSGRTSLG